MATGGREMKAKKPPKSGEVIPHSRSLALASGLNLVVRTARVEVIATRIFEPPIVGLPIMREGFITETGLLLSSELLPGQQVG